MVSPKFYSTFILLGVVLSGSVASGASKPVVAAKEDPLAYLKVLDPGVPYCEGKVDLHVGKESFVEIANELPGRAEYNELVQLFRKSDWQEFDEKWQEFRTNFPDSPLIEAGAFLYLQTRFDRIDRDDGFKSKEVEKLLREAVIVYPGSTLAPVVWATAASFFLRQGSVPRALALYELNERQYRNTPLACVFKMGIAESNFLIQDYVAAAKHFEQVSKSCGNARVKVAAQVRMADIKWIEKSVAATAAYEKLILENDSIVERFFPSALYNVGELKYREKNYASARYYFDRFYKVESKDAKCIPHSLKRLADVAFRTDNPWQKVAGYYLAVREQSPYSDVGRYSYIHGLLIGLPTFPRIEYQRRLKVIDNEIDSIRDNELRTAAYVEKGLALLDAGEKTSMDYLVRLNEKTQDSLSQGPLADFIRNRLLRILKQEVDEAKEQSYDVASILQPIQAAYNVWLKQTPFEAQAQKYYSELVLYRFEQHMKDDDFDAALEQLEQWTKSKLWPPAGPDWESRQVVGEALADLVFDFEGDPEESPSYFLLNKESFLQTFLRPEFQLLWAQVAMDTGDKKRLMKIAAALKNQRAPAYVDQRISEELQSRMWLAAAESFASIDEYRLAEKAFGMVKDQPLQERALSGRMQLHVRRKDWNGAYPHGKSLLTWVKGEKRVSHLRNLQEIVLEGKLWGKATEVLGWAKETGLEGKELALFHYMTGRAQFELKQYRSAIESLENALKADPDSTGAAEARFRLGKSLAKEKRLEQARLVFRELADKKDPFWSPLANNEIKSLK